MANIVDAQFLGCLVYLHVKHIQAQVMQNHSDASQQLLYTLGWLSLRVLSEFSQLISVLF